MFAEQMKTAKDIVLFTREETRNFHYCKEQMKGIKMLTSLNWRLSCITERSTVKHLKLQTYEHTNKTTMNFSPFT